jgi:hypothetical protein
MRLGKTAILQGSLYFYDLTIGGNGDVTSPYTVVRMLAVLSMATAPGNDLIFRYHVVEQLIVGM